MNNKYKYIKDYIDRNHKKVFLKDAKTDKDVIFDENDIFDIEKFSNEENVDYLYFFISADERIDYIPDHEKPNVVKDMIMRAYIDYISDIQKDNKIYQVCPIKTNKSVSVISAGDTNYPGNHGLYFRNTDEFYCIGIAKIPVAYWRINPGLKNYLKLLRKSMFNNKLFKIYFLDNIEECFDSIYKDCINSNNSQIYYFNDYNFNNNVLININKGFSNYSKNVDRYTDITWAYLYPVIISNALNHKTGIINQIPTIDQIPNIDHNKYNIKSGITINNIVEKDNENTFARTTHNVYDHYTYNTETFTWYSWINFINNQYDNGILITEYDYNIDKFYKIYKTKYINTYKHNGFERKNMYIPQIYVVSEDPNWLTTKNKKKYIHDKCELKNNQYYNRDNGKHVCCIHDFNRLNNITNENISIRVEGQAVCKYCGEHLGNYDDNNAFVEGISEMESDNTIIYTWFNNQDIQQAQESWQQLKVIIEAIDPSFLNNTGYVNKFIQMFHDKDIKKLFKKFKLCPFELFSCKKEVDKNGIIIDKICDYEGVLKKFKNAINNILISRDPKIIDNRLNYIYNVVVQYINNKSIFNDIGDENFIQYLTQRGIFVNGKYNINQAMNSDTLINIYNNLINNNEDQKYIDVIARAISAIITSENICKEIIYWINVEKTNNQFNINTVTNFVKNIFKKSHKFIKILKTIYVMVKVKGLKELEINFNDINWNVFFVNTNTAKSNDDSTRYQRQKQVMLNLLNLNYIQSLYPSKNKRQKKHVVGRTVSFNELNILKNVINYGTTAVETPQNEQTQQLKQNGSLYKNKQITHNDIGLFYSIYLNPMNIKEFICNSSVVEWINQLFNREEFTADITFTIKDKRIEYTNEIFKDQQYMIDVCYQTFDNNNIDYVNNMNACIIDKVIDTLECPDVLTRNIDYNQISQNLDYNKDYKVSLQDLAHIQFPSIDEYKSMKKDNTLRINPYDDVAEFYNMDLFYYLFTQKVISIYNHLFDNSSISLENINNNIKIMENIVKHNFNIAISNNENTDVSILTTLLDEINFNSNCPDKTITYYQHLQDEEVGINDNVSIEQLNYLKDDKNKPINNYYQEYNNYQNKYIPNNERTKFISYKTYSIYLIDTLTRCGMFAEKVNIFILLKNSIDNLYTYIYTKGIPYLKINYTSYTFDELRDNFITEIFDYNYNFNNNDTNSTKKLLKYFFDDYIKHTILFTSPDYYYDRIIKTNTKIKNVAKSELKEYNIAEEELRELDNEENADQRKINIDYDKFDFVNDPFTGLEELTANELIGGEIEIVVDENEQMY